MEHPLPLVAEIFDGLIGRFERRAGGGDASAGFFDVGVDLGVFVEEGHGPGAGGAHGCVGGCWSVPFYLWWGWWGRFGLLSLVKMCEDGFGADEDERCSVSIHKYLGVPTQGKLVCRLIQKRIAS